ncbi:hypothetical protein C8R46DRAFT_1294635 [Mycena filopes]|nr:hypothetical protein C8R46DRAFT_1294635 [Mycena filopes]
MSASLKTSTSAPRDDHTFIPATPSDRRSPCPALNALANHGYLPRRGTQISFTHLLRATQHVYNLSLPLALLLTLVGFLTCAKFNFSFTRPECRGWNWRPTLSWTLDLADLSARGPTKIAHDGSLVHASGAPSNAPDPALLAAFLAAAAHSPSTETGGLTLPDLAALHAANTRDLKLSAFHEQVALGECGLGWLVMRNPSTGAVPLETLEAWFGEERLPEGWWARRVARPKVGLVQARKTAGEVGRLTKECREHQGGTA